MTEFENLKRNYILTIKFGLFNGASYNESKRGNEVLHKFCESLIDNSNYQDSVKEAMKHELELLKESLSKEIEGHYKM